MLNKHERQVLRTVVKDINDYDDKTEREEYTDTGESWELFNRIKSQLLGLLRRER